MGGNTFMSHDNYCTQYNMYTREREREKVGEAARGWLDEWVAG